MATHLENALVALAQVERDAGLPGITPGSIWDYPPPALGTLPAIVNSAAEGSFEEPGFGDVPTGLQRETDTLEVFVYTDAPDPARAMAQLFPVLEGLRVAVNGHKTLNGTCRLVRVVSWRRGVLTYGEQQYHGLVLTLEAHFYLAGTYGVGS